jgi:hypothetical protein
MDIMRVIFGMLRDIDFLYAAEIHTSKARIHTSLRWIREATHVCRSWTHAALSTDLLWTNIDVTSSIPWAFEFARRSRKAPLWILVRTCWDSHPKFNKTTKTLLCENRQRIWKMTFKCGDDREAHSITRAPSDGRGVLYTILEDLEISVKSSNGLYAFSLSNNIYAPKLKRLTLSSISSVDMWFESSITDYLACKKSAVSLHGALLQIPNLETLVLRPRCIPFFIPSHLPIDSRIPPAVLPKLLNVEITDPNIEWVSAVLQLISFGPPRNLFVNSSANRLEQVLPLFACITSHAVASSNIRRLQISIVPCTRNLLLNVWQGKGTFESGDIHFDIGLPSQLDLPQSLSQERGPVVHLLDGQLRRIDLQGLQVLQIDCADLLSTRSWVDLFGTLPSLSEIIIYRGERGLFGALIDRTEAGNLATLPFQALNEITVIGRSASYMEEEISFMLECLRMRRDLGMGLKRVGFCQSSLNCGGGNGLESQVNAFKDVVELVKVEI